MNSTQSDTGSMVIDEHGRPIRIEVGYMRHFGAYLLEVDSIEAGLGVIEAGEWDGDLSSVGIFVDGEPRIYGGFSSKEPPTPEQADQMRKFYRQARESS